MRFTKYKVELVKEQSTNYGGQDFKVNSKIDVIINPDSQFDKHIIRQKMNAYPLEKYTTRPNFPYFYKSIKRMLEEKEQLIVGWSIENDVKYIYDACKRYNLEQIKYKYIGGFLWYYLSLFHRTDV